MSDLGRLAGVQIGLIKRANALSSRPGISVWIAHTEVCDKPVQEISDRVRLVDLGTRYFENHRGFPFNIPTILRKRLEHKRKLKEVLKEIEPDIVVSMGEDERFFLPLLKGGWKTIKETHFTKGYRHFETTGRGLGSVIRRIGEMWEYDVIAPRFDCVVVLTNEDKNKNWKGADNVYVIPDPLRFERPEISDLSSKRIIAVGRLVPQKNFQSLIRSFAFLVDSFPQWSLDIFGEGPERPVLQALIDSLGLSGKVTLRGRSSDIQAEMRDSSMLVMSSLYEGFGDVLVEAMSCGLPVVSYDCPCGPKDIITDGREGFLVPSGDEKTLAARIRLLIEDSQRRVRMGSAAIERAKSFEIGSIIDKWVSLFEKLSMS